MMTFCWRKIQTNAVGQQMATLLNVVRSTVRVLEDVGVSVDFLTRKELSLNPAINVLQFLRHGNSQVW